MKILFAIQGTGNGHLTRARDIFPELVKYGSVDVLISGIQADVDVPFPVKYRCYGLNFIFGQHGGVDIWRTLKRMNLIKLLADIRKIPVEEYDLIVNDFEPVSAWACKWRRRQCIGLSHQSAVLHENAPAPGKPDLFGQLVLRHYAPVSKAYGFHFKSFDKHIFTPVIRSEVRRMIPTNDGHYTVYLPAYDDQTLTDHLSNFEDIKWHVFSKHNNQPFIYKNVTVMPIENERFIKSMASSAGVLCGAGFEGPAEALYLGKKLLVIPMERQYEQQCNAAVLSGMGVAVIKHLSRRYYNKIAWWLMAGTVVPVSFPDQTGEIVKKLIAECLPEALGQKQLQCH